MPSRHLVRGRRHRFRTRHGLRRGRVLTPERLSGTRRVTGLLGPDRVRHQLPEWRCPQPQEREHQLGETVALLKVRVSGKDESVDAEGHVFANPLGDLMLVAHQGRHPRGAVRSGLRRPPH
jgi:hypothetical protein